MEGNICLVVSFYHGTLFCLKTKGILGHVVSESALGDMMLNAIKKNIKGRIPDNSAHTRTENNQILREGKLGGDC